MSTFNGLMAEFPDIRVDFFRQHPDRRPPLACFLSHIHSDHLAGLDSFRSPFLYCSAATKELLLQLERIPCRINYAKGILEARVQTYKHLNKLLKPLPLETPVTLELEPENHIQVTLFNANHCPGAVMFLFEGHGKAVLYTGDIRSEPWFVNTLTRSPSMVEYSSGIKTLDTIYLDTSFIDDFPFQTKAEGIRELLQKISRYPPDTTFHFQAWTYGYEDVWIALSKFLRSKIHVDKYKMRVYRSLVSKDTNNKYGAQFHMTSEAPGLVGFMCGNTHHEGCLTLDETKTPVVWIQPIITHLSNGQDITEIGVGGGGGDLERDAELDFFLPEDIDNLLEMVGDADDIPGILKEAIRELLLKAAKDGRTVSLDLDKSTFGDDNNTMLTNAVHAIAKKSLLGREAQRTRDIDAPEHLPKLVTFPYSRHSSYPELCHLVSAFKPKDVWPCTVNPTEWIKNGISIRDLFGSHCSGSLYQHDILLEALIEARYIPDASQSQDNSQVTSSSFDIPLRESSPVHPEHDEAQAPVSGSPSQAGTPKAPHSPYRTTEDSDPSSAPRMKAEKASAGRKRDFAEFQRLTGHGIEDDDEDVQNPGAPSVSEEALHMRITAFQAMLGNFKTENWQSIGLLSTDDNHTVEEEELGSPHLL